jgi:ATP-binding cassette, subfamily B, multidrug efflux pump
MSDVKKAQETKGLDWKLLKRLGPYIKKNLWLFVFAIVLMLVVDFLSVLTPYLVKIGIDEHITQGDYPGLVRIGIVLVLVMAGNFICQLSLTIGMEYLGQRFLFNMRSDLLRKVLSLSSDFFDRTPTGSVMTNITNDVEAIREFISEGIVSIVGDVLKLGFILVAMLLINVQLALITFISIPLFIGVTIFFRNNIRRGYRGVRKANSLINSSLVETITGIKEITLFNNRGPSRKRFTGYNNQYLESFIKVVHSFSIFFAAFEFISFIGFLIILGFAHFVIGTQVMVGEVFAFFSYMNMFYRPLRQLAEKFNAFQSAMAASERIFTLLDTESKILNPEETEETRINPQADGDSRDSELVFEDVTFAYDGENPVVKNLSFTVSPGEKVAVVGHTGAGKTTLINLINRLYDIQTGSIKIGGLDLREYTIEGLRKRITTVPQDFFLFNGSLADNISLLYEGVTDEDVRQAAEAVRASTFIEELPERYKTELLEDGKSLSTGQKQLLSFARAFVTDPSILIIDEATSNIDSKTEKLIEEALHKLLEGRTALIIAHRLSTIKDVDRILVMHKGVLVEEGSHQELLKQDGIYAQLYRMQTLKVP